LCGLRKYPCLPHPTHERSYLEILRGKGISYGISRNN